MGVHVGALALAVGMAVLAALSFVTAYRNRYLKAWLGNENDHGQFAAARAALRGQGIVLIIAASVTSLVAFAPVLAIPADIGMIAVAGLMAVQGFLVWRLYNSRDLFVRQILGETASLAFWLSIIGLFVWAAAERMLGLPRLAALDLVVAAMALHGASIMRLCVRRLS